MPTRTYKATPYSGRAVARKDLLAKRAAYRAGLQARQMAPSSSAADVENKFLDSELTATALTGAWQSLNPTGTGCTDSISVPAQGDGESQRDGRVFYINSVHVKGRITCNSTEAQAAPSGPSYARVVLYWDTQTNGAEAVATQIMDAGGSDDFLAFRNLQYSKRFIVLKDKVIKVTPQLMNEGGVNSFAEGTGVQFFKFNKTFKKPIKVRCSGTTANVSSVTDNNLGMAAVTYDGGADLFIAYQARIRFSG